MLVCFWVSKMNIFIVVILMITIKLMCINAKSCYWNDRCSYQQFSTRTSYNGMRGDIRDSVVKMKDCEAISIWGLFRHGKRYPGTDFGANMKKATELKDLIVANYQKGDSELCAQDVENLREWIIDEELFRNVHHLSLDGIQELKGIGRRLTEAYPEILEDLKEGSYRFRPAFGYWIEQTAESFVSGLGNNNTIEKPLQTNDIMAPYQSCPLYLKGVKQNPKTYEQSDIYRSSPEFQEMKRNIQHRLGINYVLSDTNITALHDLCAYVWSGENNKPSPWCALFTRNDLLIMEYEGDLKTYYRNGYGLDSNLVYGKTGLADLLHSFEEVRQGSGKKIHSYFTHAAMMEMVYSALGLHYDQEPLTYKKRNEKRKWRSSQYTMYGANFIAVLYRCTNNEDRVALYLNEGVLTDLCNKGVCTWNQFVDLLSPFANYTINNLQCDYP